MPVSNKSKITKQKEKPNELKEQNKPNSIETETLDILQSKKPEQKH